jgi:hypothetical protein
MCSAYRNRSWHPVGHDEAPVQLIRSGHLRCESPVHHSLLPNPVRAGSLRMTAVLLTLLTSALGCSCKSDSPALQFSKHSRRQRCRLHHDRTVRLPPPARSCLSGA